MKNEKVHELLGVGDSLVFWLVWVTSPRHQTHLSAVFPSEDLAFTFVGAMEGDWKKRGINLDVVHTIVEGRLPKNFFLGELGQ